MWERWTPLLIPVAWLAWLAYWWAASFGNKATRRIESAGSRWSHQVPLLAGIVLEASPALSRWPLLGAHFLPPGPVSLWAGSVLVLGGLGFTVWARLHLAGNWSSTVTVKEGHELVRSGPYGWVRHPIYSGVLVAFAGGALASTEVRGLAATALVYYAFSRKIRLEERWMRATFGALYDEYRASVPALLPLPY